MNVKELHQCGERAFNKRNALLSLWDEIALNFYPERQGFLRPPAIGADFASGLMTSYPILARRDLGNTLGSMLRPTAKTWFHTRTADSDEDMEGRRWLEWSETVMRRAMYDRATKFTRATWLADHDYAAFGQAVISVELNRKADALLYRCWHLRDVAWAENAEEKICQIYRKWRPTTRDLVNLFPGKVDKQVVEDVQKDPFREVDCRHMVVEADMVDGKFKTPYVSIYYDVEHDSVLEQVGIWNSMYVIPRWQTINGYGYSPATIAALPDARLIQAMTETLLEAGEKAVNPPMYAQQGVVRSDFAIYAGGVTWVDRDYDERMGEPIKMLVNDKSGIPLGVDMQRDCRAMIAEAFFLNKFTMPQRAAEMTAYEVGQRVQEYIRQALPIFEPVEHEYNGAICEMTFDILMRGGAFGPIESMPASLRGREIQFRFESPLHDAIESEKGNKLLQAKALLADAIALDPTARHVVNIKEALRDALLGVGSPATWVRSKDEAQQLEDQEKTAAATQQLLANIQTGADAAKSIGEASQALMPAAA